MPTVPGLVLRHHTANVKCLTFAGAAERYLASGSSDNTVCIWSAASGELLSVLEGHTSRVWDVSAAPASGTATATPLLASASADRTVRVWNLGDVDGADGDGGGGGGAAVMTCAGHKGDVYSVEFHPDGNHLVTGEECRWYHRAPLAREPALAGAPRTCGS